MRLYLKIPVHTGRFEEVIKIVDFLYKNPIILDF